MKGIKRLGTLFLCGLAAFSCSAYGSNNVTNAVPTAFSKPEKEVLVSGKTVGIAMETDGIVITRISEVIDENGEKHYPAADAELRAGDVITKINGRKTESTRKLVEIINENKDGTATLDYSRNGQRKTTKIKPVEENGEYKIGIFVRDGTSGIGTLTFIDSETNTFASLGHPITEQNTGVILPVKDGEISFATVTGVVKGKTGTPGELQGSFQLNNGIGMIENNNEYGLYGSVISDEIKKNAVLMPVASQSEIKTGEAEIICTVDGDIPQKYAIKITRINSQSSKDTKGMSIEITDKRLIEKTGGIVQGMSGSPIVQNGRLVGAVTHVTVNDPLKGYGIFIEWMLDESEKLAA